MYIAIVVVIVAVFVLGIFAAKRVKQAAKVVETDATDAIADVEHDADSVSADLAKEVENI